MEVSGAVGWRTGSGRKERWGTTGDGLGSRTRRSGRVGAEKRLKKQANRHQTPTSGGHSWGVRRAFTSLETRPDYLHPEPSVGFSVVLARLLSELVQAVACAGAHC